MQEKQTKNNRPIGIFDSGFGGLTVMSAISKLMPKENLIYFGDTAHVPYGSKSKKIVTEFAMKISKFLVQNNVKMIVIACNTASAFSLDVLKKIIKVPIIGVIEAGSACAVENTKNKKIGVIGTEGTIKSNAYIKEIKKYDNKIKCFSKACPLFVPLVEEGWNKGKITEDIVNIYLKDLVNKQIDTIILGCTHYPLLKPTIKKVIGNKINVIDSANAIATAVKELLIKNNLIKKTNGSIYKFYVSDAPEKFKSIGTKFLGKKILTVKKVEID
jgi:glutamate racemase